MNWPDDGLITQKDFRRLHNAAMLYTGMNRDLFQRHGLRVRRGENATERFAACKGVGFGTTQVR
ncbi:MAG TPA: hypothetical protein VGH22_12890 [Candidatus Binatia bacterium]